MQRVAGHALVHPPKVLRVLVQRMVRIRAQYNVRKLPHPREECSSSSCRTSSDGDESEGSLADFIEHDSQEGDGDESYTQDDGEEEEESDEEQVTRAAKRARTHAGMPADGEEDGEEATTEEDGDEAVKRQYNPEMEMSTGSVMTDTGVRRSMRSNKGRAPVRYVDEDYAALMLEDVGSEDREALALELTEEEEEDGSASAEVDAEEEEEEEAEST